MRRRGKGGVMTEKYSYRCSKCSSAYRQIYHGEDDGCPQDKKVCPQCEGTGEVYNFELDYQAKDCQVCGGEGEVE